MSHVPMRQPPHHRSCRWHQEALGAAKATSLGGKYAHSFFKLRRQLLHQQSEVKRQFLWRLQLLFEAIADHSASPDGHPKPNDILLYATCARSDWREGCCMVMQRRETSQTILGERAVAFPRLRHAEPPAVKMIGYVVKSSTAPTP